MLSNVLDFILRHELGEDVFVSRKTAKVDEQIELRPLLDDVNQVFYSEKCQFHASGDVATGADRGEYFMAPNPPGNRFHSNQICFYSNLGEVFTLPEFQAKLFLMRNWVGGFYTDRLLNFVFLIQTTWWFSWEEYLILCKWYVRMSLEMSKEKFPWEYTWSVLGNKLSSERGVFCFITLQAFMHDIRTMNFDRRITRKVSQLNLKYLVVWGNKMWRDFSLWFWVFCCCLLLQFFFCFFALFSLAVSTARIFRFLLFQHLVCRYVMARHFSRAAILEEVSFSFFQRLYFFFLFDWKVIWKLRNFLCLMCFPCLFWRLFFSVSLEFLAAKTVCFSSYLINRSEVYCMDKNIPLMCL